MSENMGFIWNEWSKLGGGQSIKGDNKLFIKGECYTDIRNCEKNIFGCIDSSMSTYKKDDIYKIDGFRGLENNTPMSIFFVKLRYNDENNPYRWSITRYEMKLIQNRDIKRNRRNDFGDMRKIDCPI